MRQIKSDCWKVAAVVTSSLCSFDIQELAAMSGHHISLHQGSDGAYVPQSLIKGKKLGGKVKWSKTSTGASQPALLFTGQRRNCAAQQCIGLHGGAEEGVGILRETDGK